MPRLTQEQYDSLKAHGFDDVKIQALAKQRGYELPDGKTLSQKVAPALDVVFGGGKVGEFIGSKAAQFTEGGRALRAQEKAGLVPEGTSKATFKGPSIGQIAADVAGIGLTAATLGGAGTVGRLGTRVAKTAALGAATGAAAGIKEGKDVNGVLKSAALSGVVGGAIPLVGAGLKATGKALTESLPKSLMQSAVGQSKKELLANKDISEYALKKMKFGTVDTLVKNSQSSIDDLSAKIGKNLTSKTAPTTRILKNEILSEVASKVNADGGAIDSAGVAKIVNKLAPQARGLLEKKSLSLEESNKLRSLIDKTLGDKAFLTSQLPYEKDVLRSFANVAREKVKTLAPEGTRALFDELSKEITFRNAVMEKYAGKAANEVVNAFDIMIAGGGFLGGGPTGAMAALAVKKTAQSAVGKTTAAVGLSSLGNKLGPILEKLSPVERAVILKIVGQSIGTDGQSQQGKQQ